MWKIKSIALIAAVLLTGCTFFEPTKNSIKQFHIVAAEKYCLNNGGWYAIETGYSANTIIDIWCKDGTSAIKVSIK